MNEQDVWIWNILDSKTPHLSDHHKYLLYRAAKYFHHKTNGWCIERCLATAMIYLNSRNTNTICVPEKIITWLYY